MDIEEKNAVIDSARITNDAHGMLSAFIDLRYDKSGRQAFGGYCLFNPRNLPDSAYTSAACGRFIWRVLEIASVSEWSSLPGKTIRVRATWDKVHAIGHIVNDDWFTPGEDLAGDTP